MAVILFTVRTKSSFGGNWAEIYPMVISCHLQAELSCYLCFMHYKQVFFSNQQWIFILLSVVIFLIENIKIIVLSLK